MANSIKRKFQFHLVRLKDCNRNERSRNTKFQFHLVRLKGRAAGCGPGTGFRFNSI